MSEFKLSDAAFRRVLARDRRDGVELGRHERGVCGVVEGKLCCGCYEDQLEELEAWCAEQADPEIGELQGASYWNRIGGHSSMGGIKLHRGALRIR